MMKRNKLKAKYRIMVDANGPFIALLSSNKKKIISKVHFAGDRRDITVDFARREARKMYPDAKDVTP
jgi:hypothetical protein